MSSILEKNAYLYSSPDLHAPQTTNNLAALLVAPINSYQSVLTLLAIPRYVPLLTQQLFSTRRSIAHSIISSVLKNETIIESPEDVNGVLELCHVLIKDQTDGASGSGPHANIKDVRRQGPYHLERDELAEEQGWVARMVHLFRAESLDVQFEVCHCRFPCGGVFGLILWFRFCKRRGDISRPEANECGSLSRLSSQLQSSCVVGIRIANMLYVASRHSLWYSQLNIS